MLVSCGVASWDITWSLFSKKKAETVIDIQNYVQCEPVVVVHIRVIAQGPEPKKMKKMRTKRSYDGLRPLPFTPSSSSTVASSSV